MPQGSHPQRQLVIRGPVLLLMGPLGSFFARFARHLESQGVEVYKLSLPLHEFGFSHQQRLRFSRPMDQFRPFLAEQIERLGICHLFMYGDFIDPHRIALDLCAELRGQGQAIDSYVFELGYLRPNYVTLEPDRVNCCSNLNQHSAFYRQLPDVEWLPEARRESGLRWRKSWKSITFIQHAFTRYKIVDGVHKLQPRPEFLIAQVRGLLRKHLYRFSEAPIRCQLSNGDPFFLVVLQVATDSQLARGCSYEGVEDFITDIVQSFARSAPSQARLFLKHHPRDRGYNHYGAHVKRLMNQLGLQGRLFYFHDSALAPILRSPSCGGVVLINSSVGFQALFHGVPLKAMGQAPFNIEGLADQQPLDDFWQQPQRSDRALFRRFYYHVLATTQINGNFDGSFPFSEVFPSQHSLRTSKQSESISFFQIARRTLLLGRAGITWGLAQVLNSKRFKRNAAGLTLRGLGVQVCIDRRDNQPTARRKVHVLNGNNMLDNLVLRSYFPRPKQLCCLAHPSPLEPLSALQIKSAARRAKKRSALLIPWRINSPNQPIRELAFLNHPWRQLWARFTGPEILLECQEGEPIDVSLHSVNYVQERLKEFYLRRPVKVGVI